jgi:hypothetical protein
MEEIKIKKKGCLSKGVSGMEKLKIKIKKDANLFYKKNPAFFKAVSKL